MEIVISLILLIALILIFTKIKASKKKNQTFKELVKKTFPKYRIIEKNQAIMICEINHRNEPDELVFIRINPNQKKNIKKSGRMLIANYAKSPNAKEMKTDFGRHLN